MGDGPVSKRLWIYFVLMIPMTVLVLGFWLVFDQKSREMTESDVDKAESRMEELESRITEKIRHRIGAKFKTTTNLEQPMTPAGERGKSATQADAGPSYLRLLDRFLGR